MVSRPPRWKVIQDVNHNMFSNWGVIIVEEDHDVIHDNNSSDLTLCISLNVLDFATFNIDSRSTNVEAPPDIIDVDEDDDFIDNEDDVPHDLADYDDEVLANDDDDNDDDMSTTAARGHSGDGGGDDPSRTPLRPIGTDCHRLPRRGRPKIHQGRQGSENSAQWSNLVSEIFKEYPMYHPSYHKIEEEKKAEVLKRLMQHFDFTPHICSKLWPKIKKGIDQHIAKVYVDNKSALKEKHWTIRAAKTRDVATITSRPPANEMLQLRDLGANTPTGVTYTKDQIMAMVGKGKLWGHIPKKKPDVQAAAEELSSGCRKGTNESIKSAWIRFQDLIKQVPHYGIQKWILVQIFHDNISQEDRGKLDEFAHFCFSFVTEEEGVIQPTFKGRLKRACRQISHLETPNHEIGLRNPYLICDICGRAHEADECDQNNPIEQGKSRRRGEGESSPDWVIRSKFKDKLSDFMLGKKFHKNGLGEMLNQHHKGIHEQFSQILSALEKNKTPNPDAPTFESFSQDKNVHLLVLDMDEDELVSIILGCPFLATARAVIDVHEGKLSLRVKNETVTFNIGKYMKSKYSPDDYLYCADHAAKHIQEQWVDIINHDGKWVEAEEEGGPR
ncbi:hypothetical protein Tco_1284629 [Tanacetum coccineum]